MIIKFFKTLFFTTRFYYVFTLLIVILVTGFFIPVFFAIAKAAVIFYFIIVIIDILTIFQKKTDTITANRVVAERLSNGDKNRIEIHVRNNYPFRIWISIIDEIPFQFQNRNFSLISTIEPSTTKVFGYELRPVQRGEYSFGKLNVYVRGKLGLTLKRYKFDCRATVPVYPSYIQMRKYELMAISNRLTEVGIKKIRRVSFNNEFDQIREYVSGDDYRSINWKATARSSRLMINQYQDEKSQQVICLIDKGRTMQMPFEGMSVLDYAINSSLVISNIAMHKQDKVGLMTFSNQIDSIILAERRNKHILKILQTLYNQQTEYLESSFELLYTKVAHTFKQRSLLLLFTNFESLSSLKRQMKYLRSLSEKHLLVVIFFVNTEINKITDTPINNLEDIYIKTIAEKFIYEKKLMVRELHKYGILSILSKPENLTVDTINKYLELKARSMI